MSKDAQYDTPLIPASSATFIAHATARINAPAALVFRTVRNTETWKDWNHFIPKVTIKNQPEEDEATTAEYRELVLLSTSRALSIDSDIASSFPPKPTPQPIPSSRRASTTSNGPSAAQRFAELQAGRRGSLASNASTNSKSESKSNPTPAADVSTDAASPPPPASDSKIIPAASEHIFAHPATVGDHGVLMPAPPATPSQFTPGTPKKRGSVSAPPRRLSINAIYGEPSVRLIVGTTLTQHTCMELPRHPNKFKDYAVIVTHVSRPDDPAHPEESNSLLRSATHTKSTSGVYRIVWGTDNGGLDMTLHRYPRFMLQFQRVTEIRSVYRGDGKEEAEIKTWEGWRGISAKKSDKPYIQTRLEETVVGLRDFCESFGGAVDRRDFMEGAA